MLTHSRHPEASPSSKLDFPRTSTPTVSPGAAICRIPSLSGAGAIHASPRETRIVARAPDTSRRDLASAPPVGVKGSSAVRLYSARH